MSALKRNSPGGIEVTGNEPTKKVKNRKGNFDYASQIEQISDDLLSLHENKSSMITEACDDKTDKNILLTEWLCKLRKSRINAKSEGDLVKIKSELKRLISDARKKGDDRVWNDSGLFLATLLLQQKCSKQQKNDEKIISKLLYDRGFLYRLSSAALRQCHRMKYSENPIYLDDKIGHQRRRRIAAMAWDNVLPSQLLKFMQKSFSKNSQFWSAHDYSDGSSGTEPSPYFSYIVPLKPSTDEHPQKQTILVQVIHILRNLVSQAFPQVMEECTAAEWWCHNRPHSSGHQLHFDSDDEGRGGVRNPICSTVLHLTPKAENSTNQFEVVGGETLITTQSSTSKKLAKSSDGWLCSSYTNRLLAFAGNLLHGVVPGAGVGPTTDHHRITFMVAFWKNIRIQDDKLHHGSARSFFGRVDEEKWAKVLSHETGNVHSDDEQNLITISKDCFYQVPIWEDISKKKNDEYNESLAHARKQKYLPPYDVFFQFG